MSSSKPATSVKQTDKNHTVSKAIYTKPALNKYGSITALTAGFGGSIADVSGPAGTPGHP